MYVSSCTNNTVLILRVSAFVRPFNQFSFSRSYGRFAWSLWRWNKLPVRPLGSTVQRIPSAITSSNSTTWSYVWQGWPPFHSWTKAAHQFLGSPLCRLQGTSNHSAHDPSAQCLPFTSLDARVSRFPHGARIVQLQDGVRVCRCRGTGGETIERDTCIAQLISDTSQVILCRPTVPTIQR